MSGAAVVEFPGYFGKCKIIKKKKLFDPFNSLCNNEMLDSYMVNF